MLLQIGESRIHYWKKQRAECVFANDFVDGRSPGEGRLQLSLSSLSNVQRRVH